jgi:crotonobetainyl-CoA:carnitine CoA-transferase CaiB-like acyl-CoA transferase
MVEATTTQLCEPILDYQMNHRIWEGIGNRSHFAAPHNCYPCEGYDQRIAIAISTEDQWKSLCKIMGRPTWTESKKYADALSRWQNQEDLDKAIGQWTINHTSYELMQLLQAGGIPAGPVLDMQALAADAHLNNRQFFPEVEHPVVGRRHIVGLPWKLKNLKKLNDSPAPLLGEHNDYVFRELLGISKREIRQLEEEQVIY